MSLFCRQIGRGHHLREWFKKHSEAALNISNGSGGMTADAEAAVQEQHSRLSEIEELVNGSNRARSGWSDDETCAQVAGPQDRIIACHTKQPSEVPREGGLPLQAECARFANVGRCDA